MTDDELLFAISDMMDKKLKTIENRINHIEADLIEGRVLPQLSAIESCYTSRFNRYKDSIKNYETKP